MSAAKAKATTPDTGAKDETVSDPPPVGPGVPPGPVPEDKGMCDNHPDRKATAITTFRGVAPQRFCGPCTPPHYQPYIR